MRIEAESEFVRWALGAWGQQHGIFVLALSDVEFPKLRHHFRKLNMVYGSDQQPLLIRYYENEAVMISVSEGGMLQEQFSLA